MISHNLVEENDCPHVTVRAAGTGPGSQPLSAPHSPRSPLTSVFLSQLLISLLPAGISHLSRPPYLNMGPGRLVMSLPSWEPWRKHLSDLSFS